MTTMNPLSTTANGTAGPDPRTPRNMRMPTTTEPAPPRNREPAETRPILRVGEDRPPGQQARDPTEERDRPGPGAVEHPAEQVGMLGENRPLRLVGGGPLPC